ncbi:MAG TPA: GNAT family N-acetyltransferase [Phycisphaerae bacterium]|jgi:RimJ/RimL family protein N-acetyltransferase
MPATRIDTQRLELIAATDAIARDALRGNEALGMRLHARVPPEWPPAAMADIMAFTAEQLTRCPEQAGWWIWYWVERASSERVLIGNGGFKGPPNARGMVEIGYSMLDQYQNRGYASEAVGSLIAWAFQQPAVLRVEGETYPELAGSIRVMQKNGMVLGGAGIDPGTLRFGIARSVTHFTI